MIIKMNKKFMFKTLFLTLITALMFYTTVWADLIIVLQIDNPNMTVNGNLTQVDESGSVPIIKDGRTLVPLRSIIETAGGSVNWDSAERKIDISVPRYTELGYDSNTNEFTFLSGNKSIADKQAADFSALIDYDISIENAYTDVRNAKLENKGNGKYIIYLPDSYSITLWIDKKIAIVDGSEKQLDTVPAIINGSTMIPLRFVSDNMNLKTNWVDEQKAVIISDSEIDIAATHISYPPFFIETVATPPETNIPAIISKPERTNEIIQNKINDNLKLVGKGIDMYTYSDISQLYYELGDYENGLYYAKLCFNSPHTTDYTKPYQFAINILNYTKLIKIPNNEWEKLKSLAISYYGHNEDFMIMLSVL